MKRKRIMNELSNERRSAHPKIFTLEMRQDDPTKCTSAKMRKFGFVRSIHRERIPRNAIVLNPAAAQVLGMNDKGNVSRFGLVVIDCSWNLAENVFRFAFKGIQRRLPALLAGNPTNYAKVGRLSSVEAVGAALYIIGFKEASQRVLSLYKWGHTFFELNHDPLEDYALAIDQNEILEIERAYFPSQLKKEKKEIGLTQLAEKLSA
jgi:pre-rRNA-processing protein TSR3